MSENVLQKQVLIYQDEELAFIYWKQAPLNYQRVFVIKMVLQRGKTFEGTTREKPASRFVILFCLKWVIQSLNPDSGW